MAVGCGSTGISPRPMLMGATHDALRASNARVSLSCLRVLAHRLPHLFCGPVFIALLFVRGPVLRTCNRLHGAPAGRLGTDSSYPPCPIWQKYTLSIEEASRYFRIGEKKLRRLAEENPDANWLIMNGNRLQIKRKQFEKVIDELEVI